MTERGMKLHTTRPLETGHYPRPMVPRFRRVGRHYEISRFPFDWKMPRPFHVRTDFKEIEVRRRKPSVVDAFLRTLPPVFMADVGDYAKGWGPTGIINAGIYSTAQEAIDDANGERMVFIPEGTYDENLSIGLSKSYILGMSRGTVIDGGTSGDAISTRHEDIIISNLEVRTTPGGGGTSNGISVQDSCDRCKLIGIYVNGADRRGIEIAGYTMPIPFPPTDVEILDCYVFDADEAGIYICGGAPRVKILGCTVRQAGTFGIQHLSDDGVLSNNVIHTTGDDGIYLAGNNNVGIKNRITGWTNEAIDDDGVGNEVAHNKPT